MCEDYNFSESYLKALSGDKFEQQKCGDYYYEKKMYSESIIFYQKSGSEHSNFQVAYMLLTAKGCKQDIKKSCSLFEDIIKNTENKDYVIGAYNNIAIANKLMGNKELYMTYLQLGDELNSAQSKRLLGDEYYKRNEKEKAKEYYEQARALGEPHSTYMLSHYVSGIQKFEIFIEASSKGCWKSKTILAFNMLAERSTYDDYKLSKDLLNEVVVSIPEDHYLYHQILFLHWYLTFFGNGKCPSEEIFSQTQTESMLQGNDFVMEPKNLMKEACWYRDKLKLTLALNMFELSLVLDGENLSETHFNLANMYFHGLGCPGKIPDIWKALIHFKKYIELTDYLSFEVKKLIKVCISTLSETEGGKEKLKEMGFLDQN